MQINFVFPGRVDRMEKTLLWQRKIPHIQGCCVSVWESGYGFLVTIGSENGKVNNYCKPHPDRVSAISVAEEIAANMGTIEKVFGRNCVNFGCFCPDSSMILNRSCVRLLTFKKAIIIQLGAL